MVTRQHPPKSPANSLASGDSTHPPSPSIKRAWRGGCVPSAKAGCARKKNLGEWPPPELSLPDLETLERLSRGEPAGPATQRRLFDEETELETIRRRKREADATTQNRKVEKCK